MQSFEAMTILTHPNTSWEGIFGILGWFQMPSQEVIIFLQIFFFVGCLGVIPFQPHGRWRMKYGILTKDIGIALSSPPVVIFNPGIPIFPHPSSKTNVSSRQSILISSHLTKNLLPKNTKILDLQKMFERAFFSNLFCIQNNITHTFNKNPASIRLFCWTPNSKKKKKNIIIIIAPHWWQQKPPLNPLSLSWPRIWAAMDRFQRFGPGDQPVGMYMYHGNPKPSFLGVITHILGV